MRQKYRTTCFADVLVDYPGSLEDTSGWREEVVGFRLVHEDARRVLRGGSWVSTAVNARAADRGWDPPGDRGGLLGLRLVVDWRQE